MKEVEASTASSNGAGPAPGSKLGGYTVVRAIGSGAMGAVYRAQDDGGQAVALKMLHRHLDDPTARERLRREATALQGLRHPAVARVLDAELEGPDAFIVTELVEGPTLEEEIDERGPLDARDLFELADQLADALEAVHGTGVVHRDLTPSNVLIARTGPVLIDFGLAQGPGDVRATRTGFVMGTPGYLAPELLDGAEPGPDTDWWSWAAVLGFAGTGRAPFGVRPTELVLRRSRQGQADLEGLPPRAARALAAALRAVPGERWGPDEVARALKGESEAFVGVTAHPDGSPTTVLGSADISADAPTAAMPADLGSTRVMPQGLLPRPVSAAAGGAGVGAAAGAAAAANAARPGVGGVTDLAAAPVVARGRSVTGRALGAQSPGASSGDQTFGLPTANPAHVTGYRGLFVALTLALVALAAVRPGVATAVLVGLLIVARLAGIAVDEFRNRRARHGPRRVDALVATLLSPWHVVRAVLGVLPAAAVGICSGVIVVLLGLMLFAPGNVIIAPVLTVEARSVGGMNQPVIDSLVLGVAMLVTVVVSWFGPASYATRVGAGPLLRRIAPGWAHKTVLALVVLALAALAAWPLVDGSLDVLWWPLGDRPAVVW
ncbi:Protein kinase domain-containing protein [Promicromonospora umidemergens]|uniref:non-specific serine/threonine protein kinase n=1 Tax=Promicromonospora umidemergens TaxID=629679 RepID=A0ABP8WTQ9_9MICO|nr:serine/threonine-protein kinase [Promicromonospora umidemergens]MCP2283500.1 Protein kinase domain-containing protein [Promicromonospora umidemergens]